jgi:hypothetical protein
MRTKNQYQYSTITSYVAILKGRGRKTWDECVRKDMKGLGLRKEDAQDRVRLKGMTYGNRSTLPKCGNEDVGGYVMMMMMMMIKN